MGGCALEKTILLLLLLLLLFLLLLLLLLLLLISRVAPKNDFIQNSMRGLSVGIMQEIVE